MTDNYDDTPREAHPRRSSNIATPVEPDEIIDATSDTDVESVDAETPEVDKQPDDTGNKEAAKYRRRLRETETERDTLAGKVAAMQTAEVERLLTAELTVPAALWASGVQLADLLDDNGNVDAEKVTEAARNAVSELGLESPRAKLLRGNVVPREGNSPKHHQGSGWEAAFSLSQG